MSIVYIGLAVFFASAFGTLAGFGTSTVLIPILTLFLPLPKMIFLVGIIHWFGDLWKIGLFRQGIRWDIIVLFCIPGVIATFIGAMLLRQFDLTILERIFGIFLIFYMIFIMLKPHVKLKTSKQNVLLGGTLSGFFAGLFGMGGAVRSLFLNLLDLPKAIYLATSGAIAIMIDSVRLTTYYFSGISISHTLVYGLIVFIPLSFLGAVLAKHIVEHIPQKVFRMVVAIFLGLVGLRFAIFN